MRIVVLGAGAMGSLFGGLLSRENEVTLISREEHASAISSKGLTIIGKTEMRGDVMAVTSVEGLHEPDFLFITVKAYDTRKAAELARVSIGPNTTLVSLQNGLGNAEAILEVLGEVRLLCAVTSHGARLIKPGVVKHTGVGETVVGNFQGSGEETVTVIAGMLSAAGIETEMSTDIHRDIWVKVLVNAAINPLATHLGKRNGALLENEAHRKTMEDIIAEGVLVAGTQGIMLSKEQVLEKALTVARLTAENKCSMLQDVERARPTEIEQINGAIVRLGHDHGIDTPANGRMVALIRSLNARAQRF